jgi:hypothetical protein
MKGASLSPNSRKTNRSVSKICKTFWLFESSPAKDQWQLRPAICPLAMLFSVKAKFYKVFRARAQLD